MTNKKEKLLNEGTIRRFMTLANIDSLSENFVTDKFVKEEEEITEEEETTSEAKDEEVELKEEEVSETEETVEENEEKVDEAHCSTNEEDTTDEGMYGVGEEEPGMEPSDDDMGDDEAVDDMGDEESETVELSDADIAALSQASAVLQKLLGDAQPEEEMPDDMDAPEGEPEDELPLEEEKVEDAKEVKEEADPMMENIVAKVIAALKEEAKASKK
jgi:hypothetical protein